MLEYDMLTGPPKILQGLPVAAEPQSRAGPGYLSNIPSGKNVLFFSLEGM